MRQLLVLFLLFGLICAPVFAQNGGDTSIYKITDVAADVTADNASHARDQAIVQAQHSAFAQLLQRMGVDTGIGEKLSDNEIADLVQGFEVQKEHRSSVRYIGTFTVQFKPNAVRALLDKNGTTYTETRSRPIVVLPVANIGGHPVLWETGTKWRAAWEEASHGSGLVPIIVPAGDLDDIAVMSTEEAVSGKTDAIKAVIDKYQAGGAVVTVLNGNMDNPNTELKISTVRYDINGQAGVPTNLALPGSTDLPQAAAQIRDTLENSWKQSAKAPKGPVERLPVIVPINTLADWAVIKRKLSNVSDINKTNVISLTRGTADIELEFRGDITQLQASLVPQNLLLEQDTMTGAWTLLAGNSP